MLLSSASSYKSSGMYLRKNIPEAKYAHCEHFRDLQLVGNAMWEHTRLPAWRL